MIKKTIFIVSILVASNISHAELIDTGLGMINDTSQNLTWTKDGNVFKTLCDVGHPIVTGWTPALEQYGSTTQFLCERNGRMEHFDAVSWIDRLNSVAYLGYSDWKLPETTQPDTTCSQHYLESGFPAQGYGYNCTGSELGYLFRTPVPRGLGNPNGSELECYTIPDTHCFKNTGPFFNLQGDYWSGTHYAPIPDAYDWYFSTDDGKQDIAFVTTSYSHVWPARNGNIVIGDPDALLKMQLHIEEPRNNATISGVGNLRGWAIAYDDVVTVEYEIDGNPRGELPYGATRNDIRANYPEYPDSLNSGFSKTINYSNLQPGNHTLFVRATDVNGLVAESTTSFTVERFEEDFFSDPRDMDISSSVMRHSGQIIYMDGVLAKGKLYNVRLQWQVPSQKYEIIGIDSTN